MAYACYVPFNSLAPMQTDQFSSKIMLGQKRIIICLLLYQEYTLATTKHVETIDLFLSKQPMHYIIVRHCLGGFYVI